MKTKQQILSPLDLVILLKIVAYDEERWYQTEMAESLGISQSEVSKSLVRLKFSGLLDQSGKRVMKSALFELLYYGIRYVFPQRPGPVVRGVPTAHSASPLNQEIQSSEDYVWPSGHGKHRGHSIVPLYPTVPEAVGKDPILYELLALVDALRVGRARERELAKKELKHRLKLGE